MRRRTRRRRQQPYTHCTHTAHTLHSTNVHSPALQGKTMPAPVPCLGHPAHPPITPILCPWTPHHLPSANQNKRNRGAGFCSSVCRCHLNRGGRCTACCMEVYGGVKGGLAVPGAWPPVYLSCLQSELHSTACLLDPMSATPDLCMDTFLSIVYTMYP